MATKKTLTIIDPKGSHPTASNVSKFNIDTTALEKFLLERLEYLDLRESRSSNRSNKLYDSDIESDYGFEYDEDYRDEYRDAINWMSGGYIDDDLYDSSEDE